MKRGSAAAGLWAVGLLVATLTGCTPAASSAIRASAGTAPQQTTTQPPTTAAPTTTASTAVARTGTTAARPTTTTTPTTVPAGARALTPPAKGTYRYDTTGITTFGTTTVQLPAVTTLLIDPPSGTSQHSTRSLREGAGNGSVTEFTLDYRADGLYLVALRITTSFSGTTDSRNIQPPSPVLLLPTGARPGVHLENDLATPAGLAHMVVDVLRDERVTVAGQGVDTLVVRATVTLPPGDVTGRNELTLWIDPVSRLWVKEHSVSDAAAVAGLLRLHGEYTATIQRLTPS